MFWSGAIVALIRLLFDKLGIERKDFASLFSVDDSFYVAVQNKTDGLHLRTTPFSRSSMVIKGPKYTRSVQIAREIVHELKCNSVLRLYTVYSPQDPSYFVSGFESVLTENESNDQATEKVTFLKQAWESTVAKMQAENIDIWSK